MSRYKIPDFNICLYIMSEEKNSLRVRNKLIELRGEYSRPKFAEIINTTADIIRNIEEDRSAMTRVLALKLEKYSGISVSWWLTGKGAMYKREYTKFPHQKPLLKDDLFENFYIKINELEENSGYTHKKMAQLVCKGNEVRYAKLSSGEEKPTIDEFFNVILNFSVSANELIYDSEN